MRPDETTSQRAHAASGFLVVLLGIAGASFERGSPPASAPIDDAIAFWTTSSNELIAQSVMFVLSAGAYLWFFASLRTVLMRSERGTETLSALVFSAGITSVVLQMVLQGFQVALATAARGPIDSVTVALFGSLMWAVSVIAYVPMAVVLAAVALISLRYRTFPRWLAWFSAAGSLFYLSMTLGLAVESGPLVPGGSLTYVLYAIALLWLIAITTVLVFAPDKVSPPVPSSGPRESLSSL